MESEVIEGTIAGDLRAYAERLASGDEELLDEGETESGAFVGEQLRRIIDRAVREGEAQRVLRLPWGVGACFRQTATGGPTGPPGIFFAIRTPPSPGEDTGRRYWRYVEVAPGDLEPTTSRSCAASTPRRRAGPRPMGDVDLEAAWQRAAAEVVEEHNRRADVREEQEAIGPRQRWALEVLRDPGVAYPRAPRRPKKRYPWAAAPPSAKHSARSRLAFTPATSPDEAAAAIVGVVEQFGLQTVEGHRCRRSVTATTSAWSAGWRFCRHHTDVTWEAATYSPSASPNGYGRRPKSRTRSCRRAVEMSPIRSRGPAAC